MRRRILLRKIQFDQKTQNLMEFAEKCLEDHTKKMFYEKVMEKWIFFYFYNCAKGFGRTFFHLIRNQHGIICFIVL
jgi:hypothetical protein